MKERYTEQELKRILKNKGEEYEKIQNRMKETYQMLESKKRVQKRPAVWAGGMAAAVAVCLMALGISNPVLAAKLPVIGAIFQSVQNYVSYSGNFSEDAEILQETDTANGENNNLTQKDQGITVSISEISKDHENFYLGITMTSDEGFPKDFDRVKNDSEYRLEYDVMNCQTTGELLMSDGEKIDLSGELGILEGIFIDENTFQGIGYVDLSGYENVKDDFTYKFEISDIWSYLAGDYYSSETMENSEMHYQGSWKFSVDGTLDKTSAKVIEINQTNQDGVGIKSVTVGKYYITADAIVPNEGEEDYIVLIYDEEGNRLDSFGSNVECYSIKDRKTEKITVGVCSENDFLENKTEEDKLKEHMLYQVEVNCKG